VQFITPADAGNSPDVVTRIVAYKLTQLWKQQIVVINRPGAGGLIAAQAAAALPKHGYSTYMTQVSTWTVLPIQQGDKMPVDLHKAFAPVGIVGEQPIAVGVNKDITANSAAELVQLVNGTKDGMLFAATNRGRALRRRGGVDQRRHRGPHPDHVRGSCRYGAGNAGWRHPAPWRRIAETAAQRAGPARDQRNPYRASSPAAGS
jgi:hypothetical protein